MGPDVVYCHTHGDRFMWWDEDTEEWYCDECSFNEFIYKLERNG